MTGLKRTPLFPIYQEYGAKTIDFGGWELPVQFSGIMAEHEAVRKRAGLFDVSHMGEVAVTGPDAVNFLQKMVTNDLSRLAIGQAQYTAMCYPDGGTVDDFLVYRRGEADFLLVVNAANTEKDLEWLHQHVEGDVEIRDLSPQTAQLAVQGPLSERILQRLTEENLAEIKFFRFRDEVDLAGIKVLISRTGYTGEDGFEIYFEAAHAIPLWEKIMDAGQEDGLLPCGLGARDTLRFEAGLLLYGNDLGPDITPIEAGIGFAVKVNKEVPFIGQDVLAEQVEKGAPRKLVGIEMVGRGIPRHGYPVYAGDVEIGQVTSGTQSPTLKKNIGLALLDRQYAQLGQQVEVEIRKKRIPAKVIPTPFYRRSK